ncbi:nucleotidyl transferase AbiEii/AbiGii toxin family protein [Nocardia asteroides]|uniref:nucleotidyl transferase AbiEii/AbiGii toxin family protein n=1 Tax=Nocardia asteroides TaxID=1824 RepID=UPI001E55D9C9|nr:nucleotidyl transferase AbiEii/AbiGii toxin family protein [Nocardia asteroides]UGT64632.1 nucleotidyl transferase AbiEii/AbiGii toxin family protein [Nocardia asteroides]
MASSSRLPSAVRTSLTDRLKSFARAHDQPYPAVLRRFVMARFLARIFDADPDGWILKGGVSMMVRLPEARHSKDIDIVAATAIPEAVAELRRIGRDHDIDHFVFEVGPATELSNGKGAEVRVGALLGTTELDAFSIDLVAGTRELVGPVERHPLPRLVDSEDFPREATAKLYPLADQIADKICAMYERHGSAGTESGRYRDLIDLLLISDFLAIDLVQTTAALEREREFRGIPSLPRELESPGPTWPKNWPKNARRSPLAEAHHDLDTALAAAGRCYNHILGALPSADVTSTWNPERETWAN